MQRRSGRDFDPVDLELFNTRLIAVSEEMGAVLQQTGFSPNIKERRDFSCAVFDAKGEMVCHAAHIPVHVGSAPLSVRAALAAIDMRAGDVVILNDPYAGGTHLPDVTLIAPVVLEGAKKPYAYVVDRAHHADIGGISPGSMSLASEIYQEGLRIPPVLLCRDGCYVRETIELFLANTRVTSERRGDLDAQVGALRAGNARIVELAERYGARRLKCAMAELQSYSSRLTEHILRRIPTGRWQASDCLDGDGIHQGPVEIRVALQRRGRRLSVDFAGSAAQVEGPLNANLAVTTSAVFYVIGLLGGGSIPANSGMMSAVDISAPEASIVNCRFPAAVAGGNVETSQRIVDVLLAALAHALPDTVPASSCGTMSNVAFGGFDSIRKRDFSYYETIGGGAGAGPLRNGASAIQTHMTNTRNTPVEILEAYYPIRVNHYRVRRGSGGSGRHRGGDGIDRQIELLSPASLTLLSERRLRPPPGLAGGKPGRKGNDTVIVGGKKKPLAAKAHVFLNAGDRLRVCTPGGGGFGRPPGRGNKRG